MKHRRKQKDSVNPALLVPEAARRLRVSENHIIGLIETGELQAVNIAAAHTDRSHWRIPREAFDRYVANRSNTKPEVVK